MFINETDIKYIEFNVINKKNRAVLKEKYFYFSNNATKEDDSIFMAVVMERLLKFKGNANNIEIMIYNDRITIECYYNSLFSKNGGYTKIIKGYLRLMNEIETAHNQYIEIIEQYN